MRLLVQIHVLILIPSLSVPSLELKDAWKAQALNRVPELDKETICFIDVIVSLVNCNYCIYQ
jgi:hypothetical protein